MLGDHMGIGREEHLDYDLAVTDGPDRWEPTRAAVRAAELSF